MLKYDSEIPVCAYKYIYIYLNILLLKQNGFNLHTYFNLFFFYDKSGKCFCHYFIIAYR